MFPIVYYVHCSVYSLELTIEIVFMQILPNHNTFNFHYFPGCTSNLISLQHTTCNFPQPYLNHSLFQFITDVKKMILYTKWKKYLCCKTKT